MKLRPRPPKNSAAIPSGVSRKAPPKIRKRRSNISRKLRSSISPILLQSHREDHKVESFCTASTCTNIQDDEDDVAVSSSAAHHEKLPAPSDLCSSDAVSFMSNSAAESCLSSYKKHPEQEASTNALDEFSDLACDEQFSSYADEEDDDLVSDYCGVVNQSSDSEHYFSTSSLDSSDLYLETNSEFSEKSPGEEDLPPSITFTLLLEFRHHFSYSSFFPKDPSEIIPIPVNSLNEEEESYARLRERERREILFYDYCHSYRCYTSHGDLIIEQRSLMVHWIAENSWKLQPETMFLAVNLFDRFLSKGFFTSRRHLQLAGIACLTLATRVEENQPYNSVKKTKFHVGSDVYVRSEVIAMEWLVQEALNFRCFSPTIFNFLSFYVKAARGDKSVEKRTKYLAVLAIADHEHLRFWPSTVAASLVILASRDVDKPLNYHLVLEIHGRTKENDLKKCIKSLEWLLQFSS